MRLRSRTSKSPPDNSASRPSNAKQKFQIAVRVVGRLSTPDEFDNIIIKNTPNGMVLLKDVGRAEIGAETYGGQPEVQRHRQRSVSAFSSSRTPMRSRWIVQAKAALAEASKTFPPGMKYVVAFDTTTVVGDSIREVVTTLGEAIIIVIIVIFLFLQDWRATIIPAITIPVSLIGTFAFIKIFGFSINSLTLFGITLATGLVVDDAIVVIENVQRHITEGDSDPHHATSVAMAEVTSAVIATSLVLISVFIPVRFFPGTTGILYRQFSLTIAFSIAISAFNALTLSPALAAILLREEKHEAVSRASSMPSNAASRGSFQWLCARDSRGASSSLRSCCSSSLSAWRPPYTCTSKSPPPSSRRRTRATSSSCAGSPRRFSLLHRPIADQAQAVFRKTKDVYGTFAVMGFSLRGSAPNSGLIFARSSPSMSRKWQRPLRRRRSSATSPQTLTIPGGLAFAAEPPAIQGIGSFGGFQFMLQDLAATLCDIDRVRTHDCGKGSQRSQDLAGLYTTFTSNDPQLLVTIDREKAKAMAFLLADHRRSHIFMGSQYVNDFDFNNRSYRVYVQADQPSRRRQDLRQYYVRSDTGQMIPLDNLVTLQRPPARRSSTTTTSSAPRKSTAQPPRLSAPARAREHGAPRQAEHAAGHDLLLDRTRARRDRVERQGAHHFRPRPAGRLPHALRAV